MTTATTSIIETWKEEWKEFHNEALRKTWSNKELSPEEIKNRLKMLNHANKHVDKILTKLNEMETVFDKLAESANALHRFLYGGKYSYEYQSLHFHITIDEHIQIYFEPFEDTDATMVVECKVEFENDYLLFSIDEHAPHKLEISLKS
ncbi:hypothetical protein [Priestia megaterium]|uniref:hypothetical protein n=1 Tax=Priestia megaterium TaxID=1404 RepID=UPI002079B596|nr:hypothetical protein [Priestia megaterium]USL31374.1 hypothetical protein LIT30_03920 [Priestia megaterium]